MNGNRLTQLEQRTDPATGSLRPTESTAYSYDELDRLVAVRYPDTHVVLYRLDAVSNRTGEREAPSYAGVLDKMAFASATNLTREVTASFDRAHFRACKSGRES